MNLGEALAHASSQLAGETARLEAEVLLATICQNSRTWVVAHPEFDLSESQLLAFDAALSRLRAGEPLPYILGRWEFFGLEFKITPHALIPRPETEMLVEHAIQWLVIHPDQRTVLEIGTGSGCIAISIAKHVQDAIVFASDISFEALALAKENARIHGVDTRIHFLQADLFSAFAEHPPADNQVDLICSNPPYIPSSRLARLQVSEHEPIPALDGGKEGLATISRLLVGAQGWLGTPGSVLVEIDSGHGDQVTSLAQQLFSGCQIRVHKDLAGQPRLLRIDS